MSATGLVIIRPVTITEAMMATDVPEADYALHNTASLYIEGDRVRTTGHKVYESATGSSSTVTITIASPAVVTWPQGVDDEGAAVPHGHVAGTPVTFSTTGALPTGLVAGTIYYVLAPTDTGFNVAATPGGAAINTSGSQSGVHTARASANVNKTPGSSVAWTEVGPTNRWKAFDTSNTTQTAQATSFYYELTPAVACTGAGVFNVDASSVRIRVTDPDAGTVYDETTSLIGTIPESTPWSYCFSAVDQKTQHVAVDLPSNSAATIRFDFAGGSTLAVGNIVVGQQVTLGDGVRYGARLAIQDYSRTTENDFGDVVLQQRPYVKKLDITMRVPNAALDTCFNTLAALRATPCIYRASSDYEVLNLYGFYKSVDMVLELPTYTALALSIRSMT